MILQAPNDEIKFIHDVIKDRREKSQATFFSVKLERFGKTTPLVDKETGDTFYETIIQYLTRYDISSLIIELYHGKSHNIKEPFQVFRISLKRTAEPSLGIVEPTTKETLPITPSENVIPAERHYSSVFDYQRQLLTLDFEIKRLQAENTELQKKCKKRKRIIEELEQGIFKNEKDKKNSLGNVSLGLAGANAIENFAKSDFGITLLKNVFKISPETLSGILGTTIESKTETNPINESKSNASIIPKKETPPLTEKEKIRLTILKHLNGFFEGLDEGQLRLYTEIIRLMGKDVTRMNNIYLLLELQVKAQAEHHLAKTNTSTSHAQSEKKETNKQDQTDEIEETDEEETDDEEIEETDEQNQNHNTNQTNDPDPPPS